MRVVREMYEASARREWQRTPQYFHPDVELVVPSTRPDPGVYQGREELFRWMMTWYEALFDSFRVEVLGMSRHYAEATLEDALRVAKEEAARPR
jgi:ketosteroid isomerase-like protein